MKGGHLRTLHLGKLLQNCGELTMLCLNLDKMPPGCNVQATQQVFPRLYCLEPVVPSVPSGMLGKMRLIRNVMWPRIGNCLLRKEDAALVDQLVRGHDAIWIERVYTIGALGPGVLQRAVLDFDDVIHLKSKTAYEFFWSARRYRHAFFAYRHYQRCRAWEIRVARESAVCSVCSEEDRVYMRRWLDRNIHVIPNGFECPSQEPTWTPATAPLLGFAGAQHYAPNRGGLEWFCDHVWPRIRSRWPDARLRIAGAPPRRTPGYLNAPGVDVLGFLESLEAEMKTWTAMIVPILIGGGTRIKILDAWSKKVPVVSTSLGARGNRPQHGCNILLADNPEDFAQACCRLFQEPLLAKQLAQQGWRTFVSHFTWDSLQPAVEEALDSLLGSSPSG